MQIKKTKGSALSFRADERRAERERRAGKGKTGTGRPSADVSDYAAKGSGHGSGEFISASGRAGAQFVGTVS